MKLGLVSAILEQSSFDELIDTAADCGLECVEVACWPHGQAERRYAGVSHIDVTQLTETDIHAIKQKCTEKNVAISALAYYPNPLDPDLTVRTATINHLKCVIDASARLGVYLVNTFIGRDQHKSVAENMKIVAEIWPDILDYAKERDVYIAIENCPMYFTEDEWPGGKNLFTTPSIWREIFRILPDKHLGINYDPSHFIWQRIDYIKPLYEFKERIYHVHFKDLTLYDRKLDNVGVMAHPLEYMAPKLPGLGDVDWARYVSALNDIGYTGYACIEIEDKAYEDSQQSILNSITLSTRYLRQFII